MVPPSKLIFEVFANLAIPWIIAHGPRLNNDKINYGPDEILD